jgi:hypothetical protein
MSVPVNNKTKQQMKHIKAMALVAALAFANTASALIISNPLSYNTPGLVGTYDGKLGNSSIPEEIVAGQAILDATGLGTVDGPIHLSNLQDYSGVLDITGAFQGNAGDTSIPVGWDYVLAKYDGQNAGYALFFFGGVGGSIPLNPFDIWTDNQGQYALSHFTVFNSSLTPNPTGVPDGGGTVALLGSAMLALGTFRRYMA